MDATWERLTRSELAKIDSEIDKIIGESIASEQIAIMLKKLINQKVSKNIELLGYNY